MGGLNIPAIIDYGAVRLDGSKNITGDTRINARLRCDDITFNCKTPSVMVSFICDDGYVTDNTIMLPVFSAQGEVACSAITTDYLNTDGHLTTAELQELEDAGWEVMSHTVTHPDLTGLTEAQIITELSNSKTILEGLGFTVNNMVYPDNLTNALVRRVARRYYEAAAGGNNNLNENVLNTWELNRYQIDDHTQLATYQGYVDDAETDDVWLIFFLHGTNSDDATAMNTLIDYIQAKSIPIVTIEQGLALSGNMIDTGDSFTTSEFGVRFRAGMVVNNTDLVVDTANSRVGIGTASPAQKLHIVQDANGIRAPLLVENEDTGALVETRVGIIAGTTAAYLHLHNPAHATYPDWFKISNVDGPLGFWASGTYRLKIATDECYIYSPLRVGDGSAEGVTPTFRLYGFRTSDQLRILTQSVGKYFADTAEFYGLSKYLFDGELQSTTLKVSGNIGDGTYTNTAEQLATATINFVIDGGGSAITTGVKGYVEIPCAGKLTAWTLAADQSGAIKIDIWKDTYANYPPIDGDSITNGHEPEIVASGVKAQDLDIADWSGEDSLAAGDILVFNVDSVTAITFCTLSLKFIKDNA